MIEYFRTLNRVVSRHTTARRRRTSMRSYFRTLNRVVSRHTPWSSCPPRCCPHFRTLNRVVSRHTVPVVGKTSGPAAFQNPQSGRQSSHPGGADRQHWGGEISEPSIGSSVVTPSSSAWASCASRYFRTLNRVVSRHTMALCSAVTPSNSNFRTLNRVVSRHTACNGGGDFRFL